MNVIKSGIQEPRKRRKGLQVTEAIREEVVIS